jgi:hypothetical protein
MVYLKDSRFRYKPGKPGHGRTSGYDLQDIIGKDDFQLMPPERPTTFGKTTQVVQTKSTVVVEERLHDKIYESTKFPVLLENGDVLSAAFPATSPSANRRRIN